MVKRTIIGGKTLKGYYNISVVSKFKRGKKTVTRTTSAGNFRKVGTAKKKIMALKKKYPKARTFFG